VEVPRKLVWVADWEMQCCGEPFAVGDHVTWRLSPCERDLLAAFLDVATEQPTLYYDHHSDDERRPVTQQGTVRSIRSVWCAHLRRGQVLTPVSGSAQLHRVRRATGWEGDQDDPGAERGGGGTADGLSFVGYLVELDLRVG
jgi:hypothetical protein